LVVNVNGLTASGSVVQRIDYDAWGNGTNTPTSFDQPFGFAGGLWDRDTGLVHFGAREYDPVTGRWLQKDPIRFRGGDTNLYAYVGGDPVNFVDPDGTLAIQIGGQIAGKLGCIFGIGAQGGAGIIVDFGTGKIHGYATGGSNFPRHGIIMGGDFGPGLEVGIWRDAASFRGSGWELGANLQHPLAGGSLNFADTPSGPEFVGGTWNPGLGPGASGHFWRTGTAVFPPP
jgi:RHS repeat-associated protein